MSWRDLRDELRADPDLQVEREVLDAKHNVGANIQRLRKEKGLSQEQLAAEAGTAQPNISALERGDDNPSIEKLARLAVALDTTVAGLFRGRASLSLEAPVGQQPGRVSKYESEEPVNLVAHINLRLAQNLFSAEAPEGTETGPRWTVEGDVGNRTFDLAGVA